MPVIILGLGKVGTALAKYFHSLGEEVWGIDDNANWRESHSEVEKYFQKLFLGGKIPTMKTVQRFFISPGVDPRHPAAQAAVSKGMQLEGELDLAYSLCKGEILAVTGTNGKSTTVSLLGAMLEAAGINVGVGGNLGTPFIDLVTDPKRFSKFVVEISSYQLETIQNFRPNVAALINISEDHLDRYPSMREYLAAKARIFEFQQAEDFAIYNDDDLHVLQATENLRAHRVPISITKPVNGAYAQQGNMLWAPRGKVEASFRLENCKLKGLHNLENIATAIACAKADGLGNEPIQKALETFVGLPHRVEWVANIKGVDFYDDSKGTNVGAVVMSLAGFEKDVVLILGGRDKGGDYAPLRPLLKHKTRAVVVIGEATEKILNSLKGSTELVTAHSMKDAVEAAKGLAPPGGVVLLSPACSSFDMFKDYHDRGEQFKKCVRELDQ